MGKYMRKAKVSGEVVAVMDVSAAPLGVRTRARALALQRLQNKQGEEEGEYLELRSRRLEKLPPPQPPAAAAAMRRKAAAAAAAAAADKEEMEASFGENMLELEAMDMERGTRETTPCSLINSQMTSTPSTPGSTTRSSHSSHRRVKAPPVQAIPSSREINEYFDAEQRRQQQAFIDKYNFDLVNDRPLPGRYEWVKLD